MGPSMGQQPPGRQGRLPTDRTGSPRLMEANLFLMVWILEGRRVIVMSSSVQHHGHPMDPERVPPEGATWLVERGGSSCSRSRMGAMVRE